MTANDLELLRQFARDQAQDAFTELVRRQVNLVYSAALRQVRSPQLAEEVAQSVFADLARNAAKLVQAVDSISNPLNLTAWIYAVTRRTAVDVIRKESRRQRREQVATHLNAMNTAEADWKHIEPLLDEAMAALDATDRTVVLLRFFENKSLRDVGRELGVSDDAAQKRVSRAVDRLREILARDGVTAGAGALAVVISANAVQAAPVGLAVTISAAALAGTAATTSTLIAATTKTIAMTTLQKITVTAALTAVVGVGVYEARQAAQLRDQVQTLQQQQAPLVEQILRLQTERDKATNRLAGLLTENSQLKANPERAELLRLRGDVTRLQNQLQTSRQVADSVETAAKAWLRNVDQLKSKFEENPERKIPELAFSADYDWLQNMRYDLDTAKGFSEETWRSRMAELRLTSKDTFTHRLGDALDSYIAANDGNLPTSLTELNKYYEASFGEPKSLDETILQRYELVQAGNLRDIKDFGTPIIIEKAPPADSDYDTRFKLSVVGASYEGVGLWSSNRQGSCTFNNFNKVLPFKKP
jgi:RNA polymerase sigma factor (sigma-70 family)